jgi:hypothetical protein
MAPTAIPPEGDRQDNRVPEFSVFEFLRQPKASIFAVAKYDTAPDSSIVVRSEQPQAHSPPTLLRESKSNRVIRSSRTYLWQRTQVSVSSM